MIYPLNLSEAHQLKKEQQRAKEKHVRCHEKFTDFVDSIDVPYVSEEIVKQRLNHTSLA